MSNFFFIYGLIDPRTLEIRYVGSSRTGIKRPKEHRQPSNLARKKTHTSNWIREMKLNGVTYDITVLEYTTTDVETLYNAETWWIAYGRCLGWDLTNHTSGGEGQRGWIPSIETRAKISASLKGKKMSPEACAKMSATRLANPRVISQETREKIRLSKLGKPRPPEVVEKMKAGFKAAFGESGRPQSVAERARRSVSERGNKRALGKHWKWQQTPKETI